MATPLGELLRQLRDDTDVQTRFHQSPAEYLHEHGWGDLDAADMQEALLLLADAAPAAEAGSWIAAGESIDPDVADAATALDTAIGTFHDTADVDGIDGDTASIDDLDGLDESDPGDIDGIAFDTAATPEPAEPGETAPTVTGETPADLDTSHDEADEYRMIDDADEYPDAAAGFDPTDAPTHPDTSLTEDPADTADHGIDTEPDWDDPS